MTRKIAHVKKERQHMHAHIVWLYKYNNVYLLYEFVFKFWSGTQNFDGKYSGGKKHKCKSLRIFSKRKLLSLSQGNFEFKL